MSTLTGKELTTKPKTLPELLGTIDVKKQFEDMLGRNANSFLAGVMAMYNHNEALAQCDPQDVLRQCAISASTGLSLVPGFGQSCVVPYKDNKSGRVIPQWQIEAKGIIQIALRSNQYHDLNLARVFEGQLLEYDEHRGRVKLQKDRKSDRVEGYFLVFELLSGLHKEFYWSARRAVEHGYRYSQSFKIGKGKWMEDPELKNGLKKWSGFLTLGSGTDDMAAKTPLKIDLLRWGVIETAAREIIAKDQSYTDSDGKPVYVDTTAEHQETSAEAHPEMPKRKSEKAAESAAAPDTVKKDEPADKSVAEPRDIIVASTATTSMQGVPVVVIREEGDKPAKYYTDDNALIEAAKKAKGSMDTITALVEQREHGGVKYLWATGIKA
jgi:recombination protein RecT